MQIEDVITKYKDMNPESTKATQEQVIIDDTENIQIEDVITKYKDMNPESTKVG
jgi:hypothetical protein